MYATVVRMTWFNILNDNHQITKWKDQSSNKILKQLEQFENEEITWIAAYCTHIPEMKFSDLNNQSVFLKTKESF